jgi:nitrite reductase/ring-hydroxylating ferredoxin subunit
MICKLLFFFIVSSLISQQASSLAVSVSNAVAKATPINNAATSRSSSVNQQALADAPPFPRTWVPLASTFELDPNRPTPLKFLNQDYITYRADDNENSNEQCWIVMDDACPHRLAPLSEGRIDREKNRIECSYHGWSFDSTGACQHIPQLDAGGGENGDNASPIRAAALASPRSSVAAYPTLVHKNILFAWLWPEDPLSILLPRGGGSSSSSSVGAAAFLPEGMLDGVANHTTTYTRDLPYSWEILVENLIGKIFVIPFKVSNVFLLTLCIFIASFTLTHQRFMSIRRSTPNHRSILCTCTCAQILHMCHLLIMVFKGHGKMQSLLI